MTVASLRCDRRRPTGVHLFHQARTPQPAPARSRPIRAVLRLHYKLSRSLVHSRLPTCPFRSLPFRGSFPLAYTMLFRAAALAVVASVSIIEICPPAGALSKVLPKYKRRTESQICLGENGGVVRTAEEREGKRERFVSTTTPYPTESPARDLAKLQARPRPAANFGFIRHATASLIRAAF